MNEQDKRAPLVEFGGAVPPAPMWFTAAMADQPEVSRVEVEGAGIEVLTWGERGKPGLLFLHGNGAHAGWWRFIAPFFAADYRVAALTWSGMGGSDHRDVYRGETYGDEILAVIAAAGLDDTGPPLIVAHSFGGFIMMAAAARFGERFRATVIVDTPFRAPGEAGGRPNAGEPRPHQVYPTLAAALARFRFAPPQGCENPYIADAIARRSLVEVEVGWRWAFDPFIWSRFEIDESRNTLGAGKCPAALIWGEDSQLLPPERVAAIRAQLPPGSPAIGIPSAEHHVMVDQPLAFVAALRGLFEGWPQ